MSNSIMPKWNAYWLLYCMNFNNFIHSFFDREIVENLFIQVIPANSFTGVSENSLTM